MSLPLSERNGSGDTPANYLIVCLLLVISLALAMVLKNSERFSKAIDTYLCWFLAFTFFEYGLCKVFIGQFPPLTPTALLKPLGQMSPMGLLWNFMGYSRPYTVFAGLLEVFAGILLIVPRLTTIGAAVGSGVMLNIFLLNLSYDVPVKIFSFQLLIYCLWFLYLDRNRLINFVLGRATPAVAGQTSRRKYLIHSIVGVICLLRIGWGVHGMQQDWVKANLQIPFFGTWSIENSPKWDTAIFDRKDHVTFRSKEGLFRQLSFDPAKLKIALLSEDSIAIQGEIENESLDLQGRREVHNFPLLNREFHWFSEKPFNQ